MYHCVSRVTFRPPSAVWATEMRMTRHRMQTSSSPAHAAKHLTELECLSESLKSLSTITSDNDLIKAFCCWMGINPCSQEPKNHPQNNWSRYSSTLLSVRLGGTCSTITFGCGVHVSKYFWPAFFFFLRCILSKKRKKNPIKIIFWNTSTALQQLSARVWPLGFFTQLVNILLKTGEKESRRRRSGEEAPCYLRPQHDFKRHH